MRWLLRSRLPRLAFLTALGPGLISGFADNDAGGITTYSVVGAQFGYDLMWVVLGSMIALSITQEVGARLGLATGQGFGGLIRQQYGVPRAAFAIGVMLLANLGDTVAEFAGIGAALAIFGVPIWLARHSLSAVSGEFPPHPVRLPRRWYRHLARLRDFGDPLAPRLG